MPRPVLVRATAVLVLLLAALSSPATRAADAPDDGGFVVHEWGTFTCVQGEDGAVLDGLQHEEEALPAFVYDRRKVRECPLRAVGWKGLEVPVEHVTEKMETPVLYFHTRTPRRVRVRVDLQQGLLTQWYPVCDRLGPPEGAPADGPLDLAAVDRSFLSWDVDLLPRSGPPPAEIPRVAPDDPWAFAREVDAAWVRTVPRQGPERAGPVEAEHYLFYRGLGTFALPFHARVGEAGDVSFENASPHAVARVVAMEVTDDGCRGRYDVHCDLAAGARKGDLLAGRPLVPWSDASVGALESDVAKILRGQGMTPDEARAMVRTWSRSWFHTPGLRVLYVVPRAVVDAWLPLHIDPAPTDLRRALVGRIECIPPATRAADEAAVRTLATPAGVDAAPEAVEAARATLAARGRFLEPHLRRVAATTADPAVRDAALAMAAAAAVPPR
jgi:hypothetical protein